MQRGYGAVGCAAAMGMNLFRIPERLHAWSVAEGPRHPLILHLSFETLVSLFFLSRFFCVFFCLFCFSRSSRLRIYLRNFADSADSSPETKTVAQVNKIDKIAKTNFLSFFCAVALLSLSCLSPFASACSIIKSF